MQGEIGSNAFNKPRSLPPRRERKLGSHDYQPPSPVFSEVMILKVVKDVS